MQATTITTPVRDLRRLVQTLRAMERDGIRLAAHRQGGTPSQSDFVHVEPLGRKRYLVAAGHVLGLDPQATELAQALGDHLAERSRQALDLGDLATTANEFLHKRTDGERVASLLLLLLDGRTGSFRIANAGHSEPMAVGRGGGVVSLQGHGPALGLLPGQEYRSSGPLRLARGMIVLAATEGVFEARDAGGTPFGRTRVAKVLAHTRDQGPREVVRNVLDASSAHTDDARQDDLGVLAFQFAEAPANIRALAAA